MATAIRKKRKSAPAKVGARKKTAAKARRKPSVPAVRVVTLAGKPPQKRKRRAKVSGTADIEDAVIKILSGVTGAITARELNQFIVAGVGGTGGLIPTLDPTISGIAQAVIGTLLYMGFPKERIVQFFGLGMAINGGMVAAVSSVPFLNGVGNYTTYTYKKMNGPSFNTIAGRKPQRRINGSSFNTIAGPSTSRLNGNTNLNTIAGNKPRKYRSMSF